jgi:hypothetical protein
VILPWWILLLSILWCIPGLYIFVVLWRMKPIKALREDGTPYPERSLRTKILLSPILLLVMLFVWPVFVWEEFRSD